MDTEQEQAYGNQRKANSDGRFLKWLKKNNYIPQHWGERTFEDDDIEKLFGKNSRKDNDRQQQT